MNTLSTHVLDTALGEPASGIPVSLQHEGTVLGSAVTDAEGRVRELPTGGTALGPGSYRLTFAVADYFKSTGRESLYTEIVIQFNIGVGVGHYHVPLLLSPFGYSTYRGS